jgi:hypothetical protein
MNCNTFGKNIVNTSAPYHHLGKDFTYYRIAKDFSKPKKKNYPKTKKNERNWKSWIK